MKRAIAILFFVIETFSYGQELDIGILRDYTIGTVELSFSSGNYSIIGDTVEITNIWKDQSILFKRSGNQVKVVKNDKTLGFFDTVYVKEMQPNNQLKIQVLLPTTKKSRRYYNDFLIVPEDASSLKVINRVEMANYLGGVIESEGGGGKHLEYYKVQAILSRTYVLGHLTKHKKEGFQLCDRVHCQAYHNMLIYTPKIADAVEATRGIVMLNASFKLAQGFFFANCGGQTSPADFVWNESVPHCQSVVDTFCIKSRQANWTKSINANDWRNYLVNHFGYPINDSILGPLLYNFDQPIREAFYLFPQLGIPLRDIRFKFRLKSTWFSCRKVGGNVELTGKGFGHGVGVCQEGAMGMANAGFTASQILNFYFTDIYLMDYFNWQFFKQKSKDKIGV